MALTLDHRQRAMLQEMGITVWLPQPVAVPAVAQGDVPVAVPQAAVVVERPVAQVATERARVAEPALRVAAPQASAVPVVPVQDTAPAVTVSETQDAPVWRMAPALQLFPQATGGQAQETWLVIWECPNAAQPLSGEAGMLLHNMLRALRLHHSPHVWCMGLQRQGSAALQAVGTASEQLPWQPLQPGLLDAVRALQPTRILLLGLHAARAVLGSEDALGRLRAQVHSVCGTPAVVSYDPAYLLRAPHAKPGAWADLCRAHALRPPPTQ